MKTSITESQTCSKASADAQRLDEFDVLVMRATRGDRRALGALAIAFGPSLLGEARAVMGDFEHEAGDVLQDFFLSLLERRSRFTPESGRAVPWMRRVIRAMALVHRAECEMRWESDDEPSNDP